MRAFLALLLLAPAWADLPVHCPRHKLVGKWDIKMTDLNPEGLIPKFPEEIGQKKWCMLPAPNTKEANLELDEIPDWAEALSAHKKMTLELTETVHVKGPDYDSHHLVAEAEGKDVSTGGSWTTVYDEGYEVRLNKPALSFFAFSRYRKAKGDEIREQNQKCDEKSGCHVGYVSMCDQTFIGWYRHDDEATGKSSYGCWFGVKRPGTEEKKALLADQDQRSRSVRTNHFSAHNYDETFLLGPPKMGRNGAVRKNTEIQEHKPKQAVTAEVGPDGEIKVAKKPISTAEKGPVRDPLGGNPVEPLNKPRRTCNLDKETEAQALFERLPKKMDYFQMFGKKLIPHGVPDQGGCGSCFAVSAMQALEMRIRVKLHSLGLKEEPVQLSAESAMACSYYNQACNGGFEPLVYRQAMEYGIATEACMPYTSQGGQTSQCKAECFKNKKDVYFTSAYGFVGGTEGSCSETQMMSDINEHGPLVVGIRVSRAVSTYHKENLVFNNAKGEQALQLPVMAAEWNAHDYHTQFDEPAEVVHIGENKQGCSEFKSEDVRGHFVIVHNGGCSAEHKASNLESAGARGALVALEGAKEQLFSMRGTKPGILTFALSKGDGDHLLERLNSQEGLKVHRAVHGWPVLTGKTYTEEEGQLADALFVAFEAPPSVKNAVQQQLNDPFSPLWKGELSRYLSARQNPYEGGLVVNGSRVDNWEEFRGKVRTTLASLVPGINDKEVHVSNGTVIGFNTWEYIDHAVTVTGWGNDQTGENPYWVVMNSWGSSWGNHGFFYVRRGYNDLGIEADSVWAKPDHCRGKMRHLLMEKGGEKGRSFIKKECGEAEHLKVAEEAGAWQASASVTALLMALLASYV